MLEKGYHVLSEKPMALSYGECLAIEASAKKAKGECMIGQCLRFYPQYVFLKEMVDSKKYGDLISCDFYRFSGRPKWGFENWFMNKDKSGGCVLDLHIHDVDIIRYIFGDPKGVSALARTVFENSEFDTINSRFMYDNNTIITAYGDWAMPLKFGFRHGYRANFENSVVVFENDTVKVYTDDEVIEHSFDRLDGIENEIEYLIGCIVNDKKVELNTPNSAMKTVRLVELLKDSARENGKYVEV
jgi:predicted dehydrogenase